MQDFADVLVVAVANSGGWVVGIADYCGAELRQADEQDAVDEFHGYDSEEIMTTLSKMQNLTWKKSPALKEEPFGANAK